MHNWVETAKLLGGFHQSGDFFVRDAVQIPVPPWTVHVEVEPTSVIPMTRVSAECVLRMAFFFHLERTNQGTMLATSHAGFAESVLALPGFREALLSERFTLELGPGLLWCDTYGIVTERERLIRLIEIVAETLQRLRDFRLIEG